MKRAGISKLDDGDDLIVFVFKWVSGHSDLPMAKPKTSQIDAQIEQVKKELLADGMTAQEISEIEAKHRDTKSI